MPWDLLDKPRDEDEPFEGSGDRFPRTPRNPNSLGGAAIELPEEEKMIEQKEACCV